MSRRRGKQTGYLRVESGSWIGYWWEEVRTVEGAKKWHRFCRKICEAVEFSPETNRMRAVTETQARRLFDEVILDKLEIANTNPQSLGTVREFWERKFEPSLALKKRKSQEHYRGMMKNHVLPAIGDKKIREVKFDNVQDLIYEKLNKGYSSQTITHIRNVISTFWKKAKQAGWATGDAPTFGLEMPELEHQTRTALSGQQMEMLLDSLQFDLYALVLCYTVLGLRRGELAGLKWKRVNLTTETMLVDGEVLPPYTVLIRESYVWVWGKALRPEQKGGQYQALKTKNGKRNIPLTPLVVEVLKDIQLGTPYSLPDQPVFASRNGTPINMNNVLEDHLRPAVEALGLPKISWHDLRHTNSTLATIGGATTTDRMKVLGHGDSRMANHYSHEDMLASRIVLEKIEKVVSPKPRLVNKSFGGKVAGKRLQLVETKEKAG